MNRQSRAAALLAFALAGLPSEARAQIGRVAGTVVGEDGRPLKGATITAENPEQAPNTFTSTSDGKGRFSILGLRRGLWVFTIQAPGLEKASTRLEVVTTKPNPPLNVQLLKGQAPAPPGALAGLDARDIQQRIDRAAAFAAAGDHGGALTAYRELLTRAPALTALHLEIGAMHERMNDPAAALAAYKRLAEIEPSNGRARAAIERLERQ